MQSLAAKLHSYTFPVLVMNYYLLFLPLTDRVLSTITDRVLSTITDREEAMIPTDVLKPVKEIAETTLDQLLLHSLYRVLLYITRSATGYDH